MKAALPRAVVLARRHRTLVASTRQQHRRRLDNALEAIMVLAPATPDGQRLRKRYAKVRGHLFTFLDHPDLAADNNISERELRPTARSPGACAQAGERTSMPMCDYHWYTKATRHRCLPSHCCNPKQQVDPQAGLSSYA